MHNINWNETYTNISPKLLGICRRYIKDVATAEDIVQDSFIVAIQKENTLKNANALNGWLSRIVINMAIHHLKEVRKIDFSTSDATDLIDNTSLMNNLELDHKSMLLASDIDRNDILEAIDSLPEHYKSVFNMYVIDNFSHSEIAKTLAISIGTSKSSLSRARKAIQSFLIEKLNGKTVDEKKKRRIAFLLFLGFGNSMFASFYQSKFQDFEIQSKKPVAFDPKSVSAPKEFSGLSNGFPILKIALIGLAFLFFIAIGFYAFDPSSASDNQPQKENEKVIETKSAAIDNHTNTIKADSIKADAALLEKVEEKMVLNPKILKEKKGKNNEKAPQKTVVEAKEDSAKTETQKVVVVKKRIVKKDTIYVTK